MYSNYHYLCTVHSYFQSLVVQRYIFETGRKGREEGRETETKALATTIGLSFHLDTHNVLYIASTFIVHHQIHSTFRRRRRRAGNDLFINRSNCTTQFPIESH